MCIHTYIHISYGYLHRTLVLRNNEVYQFIKHSKMEYKEYYKE